MKLLLSIIVIALLIAAFLWSRRRAASAANTSTRRPLLASSESQTPQQFHAVSISLSKNACRSAKEMGGKRFLSSLAPRLPLPDCEVLECKCRFVHFRDRRAKKDRRNELHGTMDPSTGNFPTEQRQLGDRRRDPDDDF